MNMITIQMEKTLFIITADPLFSQNIFSLALIMLIKQNICSLPLSLRLNLISYEFKKTVAYYRKLQTKYILIRRLAVKSIFNLPKKTSLDVVSVVSLIIFVIVGLSTYVFLMVIIGCLKYRINSELRQYRFNSPHSCKL